MSYDASKPKRGWRETGTTGPEAKRKYGWQQAAPAPLPGAVSQSRQTRLVLAGGLLALILGAVGLLIYWFRPIQPACMLLVRASYDTNLLLPSNVLGWNSLEELKSWSSESRIARWLMFMERDTRMPMLRPPEDLTGHRPWKSILADAPRRFKENTLLVFFSLHGAADDKGAYLLADDPRGNTKLYVADLLNDLKEIQLEASRTRPKNLVVVLDAVHTEAHFPIGLMRNEFVAKLRELEDAISKMPRVFVLCSTDQDQRSWASEEWRQTMFGHYFLEGVRGGADESGDGRITLAELHKYLDRKVNSWVRSNRDATQVPILLGDAAEAAKVDLIQLHGDTFVEQSPQEAPGRSTIPDVKGRWRTWQEQRNQAPWTFAPHLWRQYQDSLLRWEQLIRAGDPTRKAHVLETNLRKLADDIDVTKRQFLKQVDESLPNSLALPTALGHAAEDLSGARELFRDLWRSRHNEVAFDKVLGAGIATEPQRRLAQLQRLTLDSLFSIKVEDLKREDFTERARFIRELERRLKGKDQRRAIEVHYLMMLTKDALEEGPSAKASPDLLRLALEVRRLSEQAILGGEAAGPSYCEFIFPWIETELARADLLRREGEDCLMGDKAEHWADALKQLTEAKRLFEQIQKDALLLRRSFETRDRVWTDVPYLAELLAYTPRVFDLKKLVEHGDGARKHFQEELVPNLVRLTEYLEHNAAGKERFKVPSDANHREPIELADLEKAVRTRHEQMTAALAEKMEALKGVIHQDQFLDLEAGLQVPLWNAELRQAMVTELRQNSAGLNVGENKPAAARAPDDVGKKVALRRSLASAVYRAPWTQIEDGAGPSDLATALRLLPGLINKKLGASLDTRDLVLARKELEMPTRYCRLLPGGRVEELDTVVYAAPEGLRRLRAYRLFKALAQRSFEDHWYQDDGKTPYYLPAADAYLASAQKLATGRKAAENRTLHAARLQESTDVRKQIAESAGLSITTKTNPAWTTEQTFRIYWEIQAAKGVPPGKPMIWQRQGNEVTERVPLTMPIRATPELQSVKENVWKATPGEAVPVRLHGLYRGQRFDGALELRRYHPEVIAQRLPAPPKSAVAVRMHKDFTYGALSIVLDTSGSMEFKHPMEFKDKKRVLGTKEERNRRFDRALDALANVLEQLPPDTHLSVSRFADVRDKGKYRPPDQYVPLNEEMGLEFVHEPGPWKHDEKDSLLRELGRSNTNLNSPIALAVAQRMKDGFRLPPDYQGPRAVLVLTDGADNRSGGVREDEVRVNTERVQTILKNAHRSDTKIRVAVVCFIDQRDPDYDAAEKQFLTVERDFVPKGTYARVDEQQDLGKRINRLLWPFVEFKSDNDNRLYEVHTHDSRNLKWESLVPGMFDTFIWSEKSSSLDLLHGRNMFLILKNHQYNKKPILERGVLAEQAEAAGLTRRPAGKWLASLFHRSSESEGTALRQGVFLENLQRGANPSDGYVRQHLPDLVWFATAPVDSAEKSGAARPAVIRWYNDVTAAAPAYRVVGEKWPIEKDAVRFLTPKLDAWWGSPSERATVLKVVRPSDLPLSLSVGTTPVTVEGFAVEEHVVEAAAGVPQAHRCLVIRAAHPPGRPIWIRLNRVDQPRGEEHRYFSAAGKYTALFYPYDESKVSGLELEFICVETFKQEAVQAETVASFVTGRPVSEAPLHYFFHDSRKK